MNITAIHKLIPESRIVVFSPHFDDVLFMLGGYVLELKKAGLLDAKQFHINILFSRSNYLAGTGDNNFDSSLDRIKLATGKRLIEDEECLDELLGKFKYRYEIAGEQECFTRGKSYADSEMEFPHGMYDDFNELDHQIFSRMKEKILYRSQFDDTALVFPMAFKEHIDHFITREAAISVAKQSGKNAKASFYFQEDKPYGGIATEEEIKRIEDFIKENQLQCFSYTYDPEAVIDLAFKHYISQVEEVYKTGIRNRAYYLKQLLSADRPCDQIYIFRA